MTVEPYWLVELTDGTRTISVGVSGLAQFWDLFVRARHGEDMGEMVIFATEAQARQTMEPDLSTLAASAEDPYVVEKPLSFAQHFPYLEV